MKPIWTTSLTWLAVVIVAILLALATPRGITSLGHLPAAVGQTLVGKAALTDDTNGPIVALVSFHRHQRSDVDSWVTGLALHQNRSIAWIRMPVINDPGDSSQRSEMQARIHGRYLGEHERARLLPVFTDRPAFLQATGLPTTEHAVVLVIKRNGSVLARVLGPYDEDKARTVRDMLDLQDL